MSPPERGTAPKAWAARDALGQAVFGVAGSQLEAAEGANGFKTTLLAYAFKNGPFAISSLALTVAIVYMATIFIDSYTALVTSHNLLAQSFHTLTREVGDTKESVEELDKALTIFIPSITHTQAEQSILLRALQQQSRGRRKGDG